MQLFQHGEPRLLADNLLVSLVPICGCGPPRTAKVRQGMQVDLPEQGQENLRSPSQHRILQEGDKVEIDHDEARVQV